MAVTEDDLKRIEATLFETGACDLPRLRALFPNLRWSQCDASDVGDAPFRRLGAYDLHLLDLSDHCPRLTDVPAAAAGVLLASRRTAS